MKKAVIFSARVLKTVKALPHDERDAISAALAREFILGEDPRPSLTPVLGILYTMIRFYVLQDQPVYISDKSGMKRCASICPNTPCRAESSSNL